MLAPWSPRNACAVAWASLCWCPARREHPSIVHALCQRLTSMNSKTYDVTQRDRNGRMPGMGHAQGARQTPDFIGVWQRARHCLGCETGSMSVGLLVGPRYWHVVCIYRHSRWHDLCTARTMPKPHTTGGGMQESCHTTGSGHGWHENCNCKKGAVPLFESWHGNCQPSHEFFPSFETLKQVSLTNHDERL